MVIFQSVWRKLVTAQAAINDGIFIQLACCWNFSISASNDDYVMYEHMYVNLVAFMQIKSFLMHIFGMENFTFWF